MIFPATLPIWDVTVEVPTRTRPYHARWRVDLKTATHTGSNGVQNEHVSVLTRT